MEDYNRSKSYNDIKNMQMEVYGSNNNRVPSYDLRSYSTNSYATSSVYQNTNYEEPSREMKLKKGKSWSFKDPELQRKKRIASYKGYAVEGKVKGSFSKSYRWLKDRYTQVVYGWW